MAATAKAVTRMVKHVSLQKESTSIFKLVDLNECGQGKRAGDVCRRGRVEMEDKMSVGGEKERKEGGVEVVEEREGRG